MRRSSAPRTRYNLPLSAALVALALLTLAPSVMGRAGFQLLEEAVAARIFPLHLHGVPGEAEYVKKYGQPAPFVHPHCHEDPNGGENYSPAQISAASLVIGPIRCGEQVVAPHTTGPLLAVTLERLPMPAGESPRPVLMPPRL